MKKLDKQIALASTADFISGFGNGMFSFAVGLYVLRESSSPLWFAGTQIISPLISFFISGMVGRLVDKYPHKKILRYAYIFECLIVFFYYLIIKVHFSMSINFLMTLLVLALVNICNLLEQSAYQSSVVNIVTEDKIQKLNSFQRLASSSAQLFSPSVGAILYSLIGMDNMISIRFVTIIVSLLLIMQINFSLASKETGTADIPVDKTINAWSVIRKQRKLFYSVSMAVGVNIFMAISNIALPFMMIHILKFSNQQYGYQETMLGIGSIIAGILLSATHKIKNPIKVSMLAMLSVAGSLILFGILSTQLLPSNITLLLIYILSISMGFSLVSMEIPMSSFMQSYIPEKIQGRIFSFMFGASQLAMPLGTIIATSFVYKPFPLLTIGGSVMIVFVLSNYLKNAYTAEEKGNISG